MTPSLMPPSIMVPSIMVSSIMVSSIMDYETIQEKYPLAIQKKNKLMLASSAQEILDDHIVEFGII